MVFLAPGICLSNLKLPFCPILGKAQKSKVECIPRPCFLFQ